MALVKYSQRRTSGIGRRGRFVAGLALSGLALPWCIASGETQTELERVVDGRMEIRGRVGDYIANVTDQWLLVAPMSNPAMLEMFRDRDRKPDRALVPWAGEFAGKHLVSAMQVWRVTRDEKLRSFIADFVTRLTALQADDGYLGPWPQAYQLAGRQPNGEPTWDAWGHYHIMLGMLMWHDDTGDPAALNCARKMADLFIEEFSGSRLVDTGSTEMNLAPIHSMALLYRKTGDTRYLDFARGICEEFSARDANGTPLAGDYVEGALAGKEFFELPRPRWESLHPIMGVAELYRITGEEKYRCAFEHLWWSIAKLDRHNNGGFSSGEQAQGNPYHPGAIETCCTIAWSAMSVEMLRLTSDAKIADELELSLLNSIVGLHSPSGRWVTYNTPMDGRRKASAHEIVFQARAGSPELNCCSVNGARGFGLISDWAVMRAGDDVIVNWYGPSRFEVPLDSGGSIELQQQTSYPREPRVRLEVTTAAPTNVGLKLRIPHWSEKTTVTVNGEPVPNVVAGQYLAIDRTWRSGDVIELEFDFRLRFWRGERELADKVSIYRGPILLTYDRRLNDMDEEAIPVLDAGTMNPVLVKSDEWLAPWVKVEVTGQDGRVLRLCDFASAGVDGGPYRSWLQVENVPLTEFSRENPWRTSGAE